MGSGDWRVSELSVNICFFDLHPRPAILHATFLKSSSMINANLGKGLLGGWWIPVWYSTREGDLAERVQHINNKPHHQDI